MDLRDAIQRVALEWPSYGRRRITRELHRRGWAVNWKRSRCCRAVKYWPRAEQIRWQASPPFSPASSSTGHRSDRGSSREGIVSPLAKRYGAWAAYISTAELKHVPTSGSYKLRFGRRA